MTLRIETTRGGRRVILRLVGRVRGENLAALRDGIDTPGDVAVDLEEVTLVDLDTVHFLMEAEDAGVELLHCPPFVREWIEREREVGA